MVSLALSYGLYRSRLGNSNRFPVQIDGRARRFCTGRLGLWGGGKGLCFWCIREGFFLDVAAAGWLTLAQCRAGHLLPSRADQLLCLGSPSSSVRLHCLETLTCMLTGEIFDLSSLSTDNL